MIHVPVVFPWILDIHYTADVCKSCSTDGWNPTNHGMNHLSTAEFLPSTACIDMFTLFLTFVAGLRQGADPGWEPLEEPGNTRGGCGEVARLDAKTLEFDTKKTKITYAGFPSHVGTPGYLWKIASSFWGNYPQSLWKVRHDRWENWPIKMGYGATVSGMDTSQDWPTAFPLERIW